MIMLSMELNCGGRITRAILYIRNCQSNSIRMCPLLTSYSMWGTMRRTIFGAGEKKAIFPHILSDDVYVPVEEMGAAA